MSQPVRRDAEEYMKIGWGPGGGRQGDVGIGGGRDNGNGLRVAIEEGGAV